MPKIAKNTSSQPKTTIQVDIPYLDFERTTYVVNMSSEEFQDYCRSNNVKTASDIHNAVLDFEQDGTAEEIEVDAVGGRDCIDHLFDIDVLIDGDEYRAEGNQQADNSNGNGFDSSDEDFADAQRFIKEILNLGVLHDDHFRNIADSMEIEKSDVLAICDRADTRSQA